MKKMPFYKIYILSLCVFAIPTYAFVRYLENARVFDSISVGNTLSTAIVVSIFPALLISIWWWNYQDKDQVKDKDKDKDKDQDKDQDKE